MVAVSPCAVCCLLRAVSRVLCAACFFVRRAAAPTTGKHRRCAYHAALWSVVLFVVLPVNSPAFSALLPVILMIGLGIVLAKLQWVRHAAVRDLSNLVFYVLTPALLFRTMMQVKLADLDFAPIGVYFLAVALVFAATMLVQGFTTLGAARRGRWPIPSATR